MDKTKKPWAVGVWVGLLSLILAAQPAQAQQTINPTGGGSSASSGLRIGVGQKTQLQVRRRGSSQLYNPNANPDSSNLWNTIAVARGSRVVGGTGATYQDDIESQWSLVSQGAVTGAGTSSDPFTSETVLSGEGVTLTKVIRYSVPNDYFDIELLVDVPANNTDVIKVYHVVDSYLNGGDIGPAYSLVRDGQRQLLGTYKLSTFEAFAQVNRPWDHYTSRYFATCFEEINGGDDLSDVLNGLFLTDNGFGVQWTLGAVTGKHLIQYRFMFGDRGDVAQTALTLDVPVDGATTPRESFPISGTTSAGAQVVVEVRDASTQALVLRDEALVDAQGRWSLDSGTLPNGLYAVSAVATGDNGLPTYAGPVEILVDVRCGDGVVAGAEQCDDRNTTAGDGCDASCAAEATYTCNDNIAGVCGGSFEVPISVAVSAGVSSITQFGNPAGGSAFERACPQGQVITGYDFATGTSWNQTNSQLIYKARARCSTPYLTNNALELEPGAALASVGGATNSTNIAFNQVRNCPAGQVVVGLRGYIDTYVAGVEVMCSPFNADTTMGPATALPLVGRQTNNSRGPFLCATGSAIGSLKGRSGDVIDALSGRCDQIATSCVSPSECVISLSITTPMAGAFVKMESYAGVAQGNEQVTLRWRDAQGNLVATANTTAAASGDWMAPGQGLADGTYLLTASVTRGADVIETSVSFTLDTMAPAVVLLSPTGQINDDTPTLTGTTEPGATVIIEIKDAMGATVQSLMTTANAQGVFAATSPALAEGAYSAQAIATDRATNMGTSAPLAFVIDTTDPSLMVTSPVDGDMLNQAVALVVGSSEAGATIRVEVQDAAGVVVSNTSVNANAQGQFSAPTDPLADGQYTILVSSTDNAGNRVEAPAIGITIDTAAPLLTVTAPTDQSTIADDAPTVTGTSEPGLMVAITLKDANGQSVQSAMAVVAANGSFQSPLMTLVDGTYTLEVSVMDAANNMTSAPTITFTVDTTGPSVAITSPVDGAQLSDDTPTISGTAEAGSSLSVAIKDSMGATLQTLTTSASAQGAWSVSSASLADGTYTVVARATDAVGNASQAMVTFTLDTTLPSIAITSPSDGDALSDMMPQVLGQTDIGASVEVEIKAASGMVVSSATATVDAQGAWSATGAMALVDGTYTIIATATSPTNTSAQTSITITVDTTSPVVMIQSPSGLTNDATTTISGTAEAGSSLVVIITDMAGNTVQTLNTSADANGDFSVDAAALPDGSYMVSAMATDAAGNTGMSPAVSFVVDTAAPMLSVTSPTDGQVTQDSTPSVIGVAEAGAVIKVAVTDANGVTVNANTSANANGDFQLDLAMLADGSYTIVVSAADAAGNVTTAPSINLSIDTMGPALTLSSPTDGSSINDDTPDVIGAAEPGAMVNLEVKDAQGMIVETLMATADATGKFTATLAALPEGQFTVSASSSDAAGNTTTITSSFEVDTTAPLISISAPANGSTTANARPNISGSSEPGVSISVSLQNAQGMIVQTLTTVADAVTGLWSVRPANALANASYTAVATATDAATNASSAMSDFTIDTNALPLTILTPVANAQLQDTTPEITGQTAPGQLVSLELLDAQGMIVEMTQVTADAMGSFSYTVTQTLADGNYQVTAAVTSAMMTTTQDTVDFTVDTMAPVVTVTSPVDNELTNDATPSVIGTSEPGAIIVVEIKDAQGMIVDTIMGNADANGMFDLSGNTTLPDGSFSVEVTASDSAGNTTTLPPINIVVDTVGPMLTLTSPMDNATLTVRDLDVTGTTEANQAVTVTVFDAMNVAIKTVMVNADAAGAFSAAVQGLANGAYRIVAEATDAANNRTEDSVTITVNSTDVLIVVNLPDPPVFNNNMPTITGTTEPGSTVTIVITDDQGNVVETVTVTADANGNWSYTPGSGLNDGDYRVDVDVMTPDNRTGGRDGGFTIDTMAPVLMVLTPAAGAIINDNTPTVTGTTEPGLTVEVIILDAQGAELARQQATADAQGAWSVELAMMLADGAYQVSATTVDNAGNTTNAGPNDFVIDTMAPSLSVTNPTPMAELTVSSPTITGTSEPGATIEVFIDDQSVGQTTADANGDWSLPLETPLANGDHTINVTAQDGAGNEASSGEFTFSVQDPNQGGALTIDSPADGDQVQGPSITVEGKGPAGKFVEVIIGEQRQMVLVDEQGNWSVTIDNVPEGSQTITAKSGDEQLSITIDVISADSTSYILLGGGCSSAPTTPSMPGSLLVLVVGMLFGLGRRRARRAV